MKSCMIMLAAVCGTGLFAIPAEAQPGLALTRFFDRGAGDIGSRSGSAADLRFFAGFSGTYDNGLQSAVLDSAGNLSQTNGQFGVEVNVGAYGQHQFKRARLGLDYYGTYRHYDTASYFNGTDQRLALGYSYQKSQRLSFDLRQVGGITSLGTTFAGGLPTAFNGVVDPTTLLLDNRTSYLQSSMSVSYISSLRNTFTAGGNWSMVKRQSDALVGVRTYGLDGSFQHRQSANTAFGVNYSHIHYDFSSGFGESDINLIQGFWTRSFGRLWIVAVHGGVYQSEVSGLELVPLDPFFAQLFGTSAIVAGFYRSNVFPSADVTATRSFKNSGLTMSYSRSISGGNGVYLTSRQELAGVSYAYTGIRKWSFTAGVNYGRLNAISQGLAPYSQYSGGVGASYAVSRALYATAHYDARHYEIQDNPFQRTASRFTVGLTFSPGDLPLSFR